MPDETPADAVPEPADPPAADTATDDDDGRGSKRAVLADLAKERRERKALQDELDELRQRSMTEQEKAVEQARNEGKAEATSALQLERVKDKIEAKAGGKLVNPEDAVALLGDLTRFITNDGSIDLKAIESEIDSLVQSRPYLSARPGNGSGEGGPRGSAPSGKLNMDDVLRKMARR